MTHHKASGRPANVGLPDEPWISNTRAFQFRSPYFNAVTNTWSGTGDERVDAILIPSLIEEFGFGKAE